MAEAWLAKLDVKIGWKGRLPVINRRFESWSNDNAQP
jgi:hypothetical protein